MGAGAIAEALPGANCSPEAEAAAAAYRVAKAELPARLAACASGRELRARGFEEDVRIAAALNVSACVPFLRDGAFQA